MFWKRLLQAAAILPILATPIAAQQACNNSPQLCNRAYNNITYLGAHDSPFLRDSTTAFSTSGNQFYNTTRQLSAGVRLLSAQVHKVSNSTSGTTEWHLCHSSCDLLDAGTLSSWLSTIKTWMDTNPNDVVTVLLVNSDNATPAELGPQFTQSGIDKLAFSPASPSTIPKSWPTLQELISKNTRLMTFVASLGTPSSQFPFLMDEFTFIFENDFENESPTNYSCNPNRPTSLSTPAQAQSSGRMFLMNHFLYSTQLFGIQTPNNTYVNVTNAQTGLGSLGEQLRRCKGVYSKAANFVLVDFFNVGPAIASVDDANGISGAVGRGDVPNAPLDEMVSAAGREHVGIGALVIALFVAVGLGL